MNNIISIYFLIYFNIICNENSQVSSQRFSENKIENTYNYNQRNWITQMESSGNLFNYENAYLKNGNVKEQSFAGDYNKEFTESGDLFFKNTYDKSNRLLTSYVNNKVFEVNNSYDKDGNLLTLKRYGGNENILDSFAYSYYTGTNKLLGVTESKEQYFYDANGNLTKDNINRNSNIKYDYRNLITLIQHKEI